MSRCRTKFIVLLLGFLVLRVAFPRDPFKFQHIVQGAEGFSVSINNQSLSSVLRELSQYHCGNLVLNDPPKRRASLYLDKVSCSDLLKNLASAFGVELIRQEKSTSLVSSKQAETIRKRILDKLNRNKQIKIQAAIVIMDNQAVKSLGFNLLVPLNGHAAPVKQIIQSTINLNKLGLTIEALEKKGQAKVLSKPELTTLLGKTAVVESGEEIPYQEISESGDSRVRFKKAVIRLMVTPNLNDEGKVDLKLVVNQDKATPNLINGTPSIETHKVETEVLASNNETIVLGGLFELYRSGQHSRNPVLGALPLVGGLFTKHNNHTQQHQLLIFITPSW